MFSVVERGNVTDVGRRLEVQMKFVVFEGATTKFDWRVCGPVRPEG